MYEALKTPLAYQANEVRIRYPDREIAIAQGYCTRLSLHVGAVLLVLEDVEF